MNGRPDLSRLAARLAKFRLPALILCLGVVLMLLPGKNRTTQQITADAAAQTSERFDLTALEHQLSGALSEISGVGECTVVLTLRSSGEQVLAQDTSEGASSDTETASSDTETVIISTGTGTEEAVSVKTIYPEFQGALVICEGADQAGVKLDVLKAVSAVTGLRSDQISICQRK